MRLEPYRRVLARPGVRTLMLVAILARIPVTAAGLTLTLHVVLDLDRGYAAAGLVGAACTLGSAVGAPLLGRLVDRSGLRRTLMVTTIADGLFWAVAPELPYPILLGAGFIGGVLAVPVFNVVRQSLAALVPVEDRRQAYSLDSISVELSFMIGPATAVLIATGLSPSAAMWAVGAAIVLAGLGLWRLNPPTLAAAEVDGAPPPARRAWLRPRLVAVLCVAGAATFVLGGSDVGVVAIMREAGQVRWTGLVLAAWGFYSMTGGFMYGAARRGLPPAGLIALLGLCTIPIGLAQTWWQLAMVLVAGGALCAPTIAATADAVSRLVPASARGEAMGWYGSALTIGIATGAPAVGAVVDRWGAFWGFVVAGTVGLAGAGTAVVVNRLDRAPATPVPLADLPVPA